MTYSKNEATWLAAVGILLMVWHHFFGFMEYLEEGLECRTAFMIPVIGVEVERLFASFGKLCVALFAFMSGYALWVNRESMTLTKTGARIGKFLVCYWICLGFFMIAALLTSSPLPDWNELLPLLIGQHCDPSDTYVNIPFAWYVNFYIFFLLVSPLLIWLAKKGMIGIVGILCLLQVCAWLPQFNTPNYNFGLLYPIEIACLGLMMAKYDLINKSLRIVSRVHWSVLLAGTLLLVPIRRAWIYFHLGSGSDLFITPILVILMIPVLRWGAKYEILRRGLDLLGKNSMNLWYLHGIFFTVLPIQWILYLPKYPILIYMWGLVLLVPISILIMKVQDGAWKLFKSVPRPGVSLKL